MDTKQRNFEILTAFMNTDWTSSDLRKKIADASVDKLPILPLDFKLENNTIQELSNLYEQNISQAHQICTTTNLPDTYKKLTIFGPKTNDEYTIFHKSTHTSSSWQTLEDSLKSIQLDWQLDAPFFREQFKNFPYNKLYAIEFFCKKPGEYSSVHRDRDNPNIFKGVHNRIYVPLDWDNDMEFGCFGLGRFHMEPGRFYALNGNAYIHGAWNLSKTRTAKSIIIVIDPTCKHYNDMINISYQKYNLFH